MNYPLFAGRTDDSGVFAQQCTLLLNLHTFKAACPLWYPLAPELTSNLLFHLPFWPQCHPHLTTHSELQLFHKPQNPGLYFSFSLSSHSSVQNLKQSKG